LKLTKIYLCNNYLDILERSSTNWLDLYVWVCLWSSFIYGSFPSFLA